MKIFNSIVIKLWLTIILIVTAVLFLLSISLFYVMEHTYKDKARSDLLSHAVTIQKYYTQNHQTEVSEIELSNHINEDVGYIFFNRFTNEIMRSNDIDPDIEKVLTKQMDSTLITKPISQFIELDRSNYDKQYVIVKYPIKIYSEKGMSTHTLIIFQDLSILGPLMNSYMLIIFIVLLLMLLIVTIFAFYLINRLVKPLISMKDKTLKMAQGDYKQKLAIPSKDEIGELAIAINKMSKDTQLYISSIEAQQQFNEKLLEEIPEPIFVYEKDFDDEILMNSAAKKLLPFFNQLSLNFSDVFKMIQTSQYQNNLNEKLSTIDNVSLINSRVIQIADRFFIFNVAELNNNRNNDDGYFIFNDRNIKTKQSVFIILLNDVTTQYNEEKMKAQFIRDLSHELRTPMSMIIGYTEAIKDGVAETDEERQMMLDIIHDESKRLNNLINDFSQISKLNQFEIKLNKTEISTTDIEKWLIQTFSNRMVEHKIKYIVNNEIDDKIVIDYEKFQQIFINLLDNALRYTDEGDCIKVMMKPSHIPNYRYEIIICDTGVGIHYKDIPYIFDRLYKVDQSRVRGKSGTGLGLFIVKQIVNAHQGEIKAKSEINQGTTFTIYLP